MPSHPNENELKSGKIEVFFLSANVILLFQSVEQIAIDILKRNIGVDSINYWWVKGGNILQNMKQRNCKILTGLPKTLDGIKTLKQSEKEIFLEK